MIDTLTTTIVCLFFFHGALASFIVGFNLWPKKDRAVKFFGLAFIFSGLAFTTWGLLVLEQLVNLKLTATLAAVFIILAMFSFFLSGIQHLEDSESYGTALFIGAAGALGLFVLRSFIFPAHIIITHQGFLLFNLRTPLQIAYIFAILVSLLPAANAVAGKFKATLGPLIKGASIALAVGGIILVTSQDTALILADGIVMSIAFLLLWVTILTSGEKILRKAA